MSGGSYVRRKRRVVDNYTQISNTLLRDPRLSLKARGLCGWLLSHSTEYRFTVESIAERNECGVDQVKSGLKELEACGYLERVELRESGRIIGMEYVLDDDPSVTVGGKSADGAVTVSGFSTDGKPAGGGAIGGRTVAGKPGGHIEDEVPRTPKEQEDHHAVMRDEFWAIVEGLLSVTVGLGGRDSVRAQIDEALFTGWTPEALARWVRTQVPANHRLSNPAGAVVTSLRTIPHPSDVAPPRRQLDDDRAAQARADALARKRAREACALCDNEGYIGTRLCSHDPQQNERNETGAAKVRDALAARRAKTGSRTPERPSARSQGKRAVQ